MPWVGQGRRLHGRPDIPHRALTLHDVQGSVWAELGGLNGGQNRVVDILTPSQSTLAPGAGIDVTITGDWKVREWMVDFADGVTGAFYIDERERGRTRDLGGMAGGWTTGGDNSFMRVQSARIVATNTTTETRDVRAWMVVR